MRQFAARQPSAILFAAQLAAILIYPFLEDRDAGRAIFSVLGIAILGLVLLAVRGSPAWLWLGIVLAAPATVLLLIQAITGDDALLPYSSAFEAVLYFYAAGALIAYILADHEITRDEIWAIGATFTLLAWAFAYAYTVVQAAEPDSFTAAVNAQDPRSWTRAALPQLHHPDEHRPQRRHPGEAVRALSRDGRAVHGSRVHRDAGVAGGRAAGHLDAGSAPGRCPYR